MFQLANLSKLGGNSRSDGVSYLDRRDNADGRLAYRGHLEKPCNVRYWRKADLGLIGDGRYLTACTNNPGLPPLFLPIPVY